MTVAIPKKGRDRERGKDNQRGAHQCGRFPSGQELWVSTHQEMLSQDERVWVEGIEIMRSGKEIQTPSQEFKTEGGKEGKKG